MGWHITSVRIFALATIVATAPIAARAAGDEGEPQALAQSVTVRDVLDGSGPSHLIARGRALILFDPNEGVVRRYALDADDRIAEAPTACAMPRSFSPRYVLPLEQGLRVVGEDPKPAPTASNAHLPVMDITDDTLAAMAAGEPRSKVGSCGEVKEGAATTIPVEAQLGAHGGFLVSASRGTPLLNRGAILVGPDRGAELFNVRAIGRADNFGPAVLRRELIGGSPPGTVEVALWVTLFKNGRPTSIRLVDHRAGPDGKVLGMAKRGFEFSAVAGHSLYIVGTTCGNSFCIQRYDLSILRPGDGVANNPVAWIDLANGSDRDYPEDGPLAVTATPGGEPDGAPIAPAVSEWLKTLVGVAGHYAFVKWSYPAEARSRPCADGPDQCQVRLRAGLIIEATRAESGDARIEQKEDEGRDALWIGPRHLIDAAKQSPPGKTSLDEEQEGMPYSFGGDTAAKGFNSALVAPVPRPIGHIRELLNGVGVSAYPIGIDCSGFIGRVFGDVRKMQTSDWVTRHLPIDQVAAVPDLRAARPGDVIVKNGHIVIFSGRPSGGANLSVEVFEAGSRCGRACRSVYDPDFFNGWRIMRIHWMTSAEAPPMENPYWRELAPR